MAINLVKGQRVEIGLSKLKVELGWKVNPNANPPYDLDASTFLLREMVRLASRRISFSMGRVSRLTRQTVNVLYQRTKVFLVR